MESQQCHSLSCLRNESAAECKDSGGIKASDAMAALVCIGSSWLAGLPCQGY